MITIRSLAETDSLEAITELLHRAYARLGAMGLNYTAVDQAVEITAERVDAGQCYLAEWTGRLAGTITVEPTDPTSECAYFTLPRVATFHQLGVEPSLQRRGIGRALIATCEAWAQERGFRELALDTAEPAEHLVRYYTGLGYLGVDRVKWSGKTYQSLILSKVLDDALTLRRALCAPRGL